MTDCALTPKTTVNRRKVSTAKRFVKFDIRDELDALFCTAPKTLVLFIICSIILSLFITRAFAYARAICKSNKVVLYVQIDIQCFIKFYTTH